MSDYLWGYGDENWLEEPLCILGPIGLKHTTEFI